MDISKENPILLRHEVVITYGNTKHTLKFIIKIPKPGHFSAMISEHILPDDTLCSHVPNIPHTGGDIIIATQHAAKMHFEKFHPEQKRPGLSIVK